MKLVHVIEEKFWILLIVAVFTGLVFPLFGKSLQFLVIPCLMVVLFLTYLKVDFIEVIVHIKKPFFLMYILFMFLLFIPAVLYGFFHFFKPELAIGVLLLCAMPPGIASPVFTDIVKGNTSLSVIISFIAYLIAPFTLLFLLTIFTQKVIQLDFWNVLKTMMVIGFLPLVSAQIIRAFKREFIVKTQTYYGVINIFFIALIAYIVIAHESNNIFSNPIRTLFDILWLYIIFIMLHVAGFVVAFWRKKEDRIALSVSKTYMNNALAIGLAFAFFDPKIALFMVLSEIPWNTTLGLFKHVIPYLR